MSLESFQGLVREFGGKLGVPDVEADAEGYVALTFDDLVVHLQHDAEEDEAVVFARLGEVEQDRAEQVYLLLLAANLFWQGAKGATLSLEPATSIVFLADRRAMAVLRPDPFADWLQRFLDVAGYWRKRLADVNAGGPLGLDDEAGEASPTPPEDGGRGRRGGDFVLRV